MYKYSLLRFASELVDDDGAAFVTEYEPFLFKDFADNTVHVALGGDTWWSLAATYYPDHENQPYSSALLWKVIADFQPDGPVVDPTLTIAPGTLVYVPSIARLDSDIFSDRRRPDLGF